MMLLSDLVYETKEDLKEVLDGYRAKGTEVNVTLKIPMCPELFVDELEIGLNILEMDSFVSYKNTGKLDLSHVPAFFNYMPLFFDRLCS